MADFARVLSHSRLFYGMPPASLADLVAHSRVERIAAEGNDLSEGHLFVSTELRVILEGDLWIPAEDLSLGRGNFIGESTLMELALPDVIRARSRTGCTCLVVTRPVIYGWMQRHQPLQAALYQHLSQELFNRSLRKAA